MTGNEIATLIVSTLAIVGALYGLWIRVANRRRTAP